MSTMRMSGSQIVLKALEDQGVDVIFGYPGGAVLPIYDAIFQQNKIRHVLVRHEQGATHMAEGYARSTGRPGVVLVTSGPGATNAVTGLTDAMMDSIPIICLTGQVATHLIGNDAFQEADTVGITRPCTKHNYLVKDVNDLARIIHEAFYIANSGRPGPVVVDIPKDVSVSEGEYATPQSVHHKSYRPQLKGDDKAIEEAVEVLINAKRPVFYTGGGVINSGILASERLTELVHMSGYPITSTLMGLGCFPASDHKWLGMLGMHGTYEANLAMAECDVMVAIGARFDDRITGRLDEFSKGSTKIHIDIDPSSINKNVQVDIPIIGDCAQILGGMVKLWNASTEKPDEIAIDSWWAQIKKWRGRQCLSFDQGDSVIKPQYALERLREKCKNLDTYITTDVGQHQMWAAQFLPFEKPNRWMTSGGLGTMGYGLPAAIGVQIAHPESTVVCVSGEASIMMCIQELSTAVQHRTPVKIFLLNNRYMGMVRQWQELLHGGRYAESYMESLPDFVTLAESFGVKGIRAHNADELDGVIDEMIDTDGPVIADIQVDPEENCFPMIPAGSAHYDMLLGPVETTTVNEDGLAVV